jgi:hypothetical protein
MAQLFSTYDPASIKRTAYGTVPNPTALPDRRAQLEALGVPVGQLNEALTSNALNELRGNVSYEPSMNYAAATGVRTGLQGSEFARRIGASDYMNRVEAARQRGTTNAQNILQTITGTQTISPETQIGLDQQNQALASAPDPQMAANAAIGAYQSALNRASSYYSTPSRNSGGGGPAYSMSTPTQGAGQMPDYSAWFRTNSAPQLNTPTAPQPSAYQAAVNSGGGGWNNATWGSGGGAPSSAALNVNGYDIYDPAYYQSMAETYNPGVYSSGTDWSQFE